MLRLPNWNRLRSKRKTVGCRLQGVLYVEAQKKFLEYDERSGMKNSKTVDNELADHLKEAEHHLIEAINLLSRHRPVRGAIYIKRLGGAQETVTALYREELVRMRGPLKPPRVRKLTK